MRSLLVVPNYFRIFISLEINSEIDKDALIDRMTIQIGLLQRELAQLKKMIFGARSERFSAPDTSATQLELGFKVDATGTAVVEQQTITVTKKKVTQAPIVHPGRTKLPDHLRRERVFVEPEAIPPGARKIGEEITEELNYVAPELYVLEIIRPRYVTPDAAIIIADMPARPVEKAIAGASLLAHVVIEKYADHLPLYRQMQRFERAGIKLAYSTLSDWVSATCKLIDPLYGALKKQVLRGGYIHADETPIKVLDKNKSGQTHRGYFWVYRNGPGKSVLFDYRQGRGRQAPMEMLGDFKGYLQTDGYAAYDSFDKKEGVTLIHCMAHARRYFVEAADNDRERAEYVLKAMQQVYGVERQCRELGLDFERRRQKRADDAVPVLNALGEWMKTQIPQTNPRSAIYKALAYSIQRWDKLCLYATDGMLEIDNNPVENSIRPVALGRKNYLFCGSQEAAQRTAVIYSLLGTCKLNGVNPYTWLRDVLEKLPTTKMKNIDQLLPQNWIINQM